MARLVVPNIAHHVVQRGNRRQRTFFGDRDFRVYRTLVANYCKAEGVSVWAYCLMPNHVHLIAVPDSEEGLRRAIGEAHRRYTEMVNKREKWTGHLWQGRFSSFPLEGRHLVEAVRYVELNPVRAGIVKEPEQYPWSSASSRIHRRQDRLRSMCPFEEFVSDWREFLKAEVPLEYVQRVRVHERTGRPLGSEAFVAGLEQVTGRQLLPRKRGRKALIRGHDG